MAQVFRIGLPFNIDSTQHLKSSNMIPFILFVQTILDKIVKVS